VQAIALPGRDRCVTRHAGPPITIAAMSDSLADELGSWVSRVGVGGVGGVGGLVATVRSSP
jgi:hypothetical protein